MNWLLFLFTFILSPVLASEVTWEKNVQVEKIRTESPNTFTHQPNEINLNTAEKTELMKLKGVGPKKAEAIIAYRTTHGSFKEIKDLQKIKGFSKKLVTNLIEDNKDTLVVNKSSLDEVKRNQGS